MSVIIDTTMSEVKALIRYARICANNCMIANSWEVTKLVRCKECKYSTEYSDKQFTCKWFDTLVLPDDFCSNGRGETEKPSRVPAINRKSDSL